MCAHNNPWKELVLPCKVPLMQYLFQTPQKTHSALSVFDPAVELNSSKIRAGLSAKFSPEGLQAADLVFTMETAKGSWQQGLWVTLQEWEQLGTSHQNFLYFLSLHMERSEQHQQWQRAVLPCKKREIGVRNQRLDISPKASSHNSVTQVKLDNRLTATPAVITLYLSEGTIKFSKQSTQ